MIDTTLPIATVSETNQREHWSKRHKRRKAQREETFWSLKQFTKPTDYPLTVTLTRISPRKLDNDDNLNSSCKAIRDGVADWLGIDDGSDQVQWRYAQTKGEPKQQAVRIQIAPAT